MEPRHCSVLGTPYQFGTGLGLKPARVSGAAGKQVVIPFVHPQRGMFLGAQFAVALNGVTVVNLEDEFAASDLTFISVWSPTFLINLVEALPALAEPLLKSIRDGAVDPQRMHVISIALARRPIDTRSIWPRLATVSAWADGGSRAYAGRLQELFPHARLQPKGLLATEGAVTIPRQGSSYGVPALASAFLEFIDDAGRAHLCDELRDGESYRVVMTTPGGLYRYDLGDRLSCRGYTGALPRLEFIHHDGIYNDGLPFLICWVPMDVIDEDVGGLGVGGIGVSKIEAKG